MKKYTNFLWLILIAVGCKNAPKSEMVVASPDKQIQLEFIIEKGKPAYVVKYKETTQIDTSYLGIDFKDQDLLNSRLKVINSSVSSFDKNWEMPWGEQKIVRNNYNELKVELFEETGEERTFSLVFRVFDHGLGFRYEFPEQKAFGQEIVIMDELTEFNLTGDHKVWWIPGDWDIYEYLYQTTKFSEIDALALFIPGDHLNQTYIPENAVNTPVTMKTDEGVYLSFHEADLTNYPGMTLKVDTENISMSSELVGNKSGIKAKVNAPFVTPWRTIQITDSAPELIESNIIVNLNDPNIMGDVSWFEPMKYVGIWWDMHLGRKSWDLASGKHGATTEYTKELIDFASQNNIGGILVEGWNTGWETWISDARDTIFDFTTPYPDYDLEEVVRYGKEKGVELIMHHETSASVAQYEKRMDVAYGLMEDLGIHAVKTGYVGSILPEGEYHHGQWMVNHYQKTLEYGAKHKVAINMHEPIKATGKRRTFPTAISREGLRGQEYNAWAAEGACPPEHLPIVAFTRMLAGPIDYTPGIFNLSLLPFKENHPIKSTLAQQLSLYVVIYSPIQMAADLIDNYKNQPAMQFIRDVAVDWERSNVLDGEVGDNVVIARQQRDSDNWFVGGLTDENRFDYTLELDFLDVDKSYTAKVYRDAEDTHYLKNSTSIDIIELKVKKGDKIPVNMAEAGGFAVSLMAD